MRLNTTKTSNIVISFIQKDRSPKIPNPDKYNSSRENLNNFFIKLKLKLEGNSDYFNNKKQKILYLISRLERRAMKLI